MKLLCTLLVLCNFGLNETSPTLTETSPISNETTPILTHKITNETLIQVFRISNGEATFDDAVNKCKEKESILFEPKNDDENQQVYDLASKQKEAGTDRCDGYFIGIKAEDGM